jgi:hypothetical protein
VLEKRGGKRLALHHAGPPAHIQFSAGSRGYAGQEPVRRLKVRLYETYYDGATIRVHRDEVVYTADFD